MILDRFGRSIRRSNRWVEPHRDLSMLTDYRRSGGLNNNPGKGGPAKGQGGGKGNPSGSGPGSSDPLFANTKLNSASASGATVADGSAVARALTVTGALVQAASARFGGQALFPDATAKYATATNNADWDVAVPASQTCWEALGYIDVAAMPANAIYGMLCRSTAGGQRLCLTVECDGAGAGRLTLINEVNLGGNIVTAYGTIVARTNFHVCMMNNVGAGIGLFINGALVTSTTILGDVGANLMFIGAQTIDGTTPLASRYFNGELKVRVTRGGSQRYNPAGFTPPTNFPYS